MLELKEKDFSDVEMETDKKFPTGPTEKEEKETKKNWIEDESMVIQYLNKEKTLAEVPTDWYGQRVPEQEAETVTIEEKKLNCKKCSGLVDSDDRACRKCGQFILKAGEVLDLSEKKVNFDLPITLGDRAPFREKGQSEFDTACPQDPEEMNKWVLNHLPITVEEKYNLVMQLATEGKERAKFEKRYYKEVFDDTKLEKSPRPTKKSRQEKGKRSFIKAEKRSTQKSKPPTTQQLLKEVIAEINKRD